MQPRFKQFRVVLLAGVASALAFLLPPAFAQTGPTITGQPASQTNLEGASLTLSVGVSGTGPFTYQWQFNGTNLPNKIITTVAGSGSVGLYPGVPGGFWGDGGAAIYAGLNNPGGVAVDASGYLFIADTSNNRVRKVDLNGVISTVAGNGPSNYSVSYSGDGGAATNTTLNLPEGVAVDASGSLFIADTGNSRIRKVDTQGIISTVAGNGSNGYSGDGGAATNASLSDPYGVAMDASGNLFIADSGNNRIRKVDTNGIIATVAGNGYQNPNTGEGGYSGDGGAGTNASLNYPSGVAVDSSGNLFIADEYNNRIRKVDVNGVISTVAGNGSYPHYVGDGGAATNASLDHPDGAAVDAYGNLFISDRDNNRICKVDVNGMITTVAGNRSSILYLADDGGAATNASLPSPGGVAADASGNIFIPDTVNYRIRKVDLNGIAILTLNNVSASVAGNYQVIVISPYGSVTSMVASLTVINPTNQTASIVMNPPAISGPNLVLGFSLSGGTNTSFTLLQTPSLAGSWTTNTAAVLTTNVQAGGYQFTIPTPASTEFFQVRSP